MSSSRAKDNKSTTQTLSMTVSAPKRSEIQVNVTLAQTEAPESNGQHLLFPTLDPSNFLGYPTCTATVTSSRFQGYASMYGWIQFVRDHETDAGQVPWELDPIPITDGLDTPYAWFGADPTLYDAPSRIDCVNIDWSAVSFLTYHDDALMTRAVKPLLAFEWGFKIQDGVKSAKPLRRLELASWNEHLAFLRSKFPNWQFAEAE
ncbi:hypothetical protein ANO11243_094460 [Dothideomycetidae sp. 11243]|nr:hypothetical protein ANO11243_094460 [fungal sp. No.11243]